MARAKSAPATAKGAKPPGAQRLQRHLAGGGGAEVGDLIERVKRAAIGIGRLGVDPGLDDRIEAGEDEADQRAEDEPRRRRHEHRHQDDAGDGERHERGESADVTAASDDDGRGQGPGQHTGEIDRSQQSDGEVGKALEPRSQGRRDADQRVAADQEQHRKEQGGDRGEGVQGGCLLEVPMVACQRPARDRECFAS